LALAAVLTDRLRTPQKTSGLQGPIDDALTGPFLCVRGTRDGWHNATQQYAEAEERRLGRQRCREPQREPGRPEPLRLRTLAQRRRKLKL
jgi:hypothetical protein